MPGHCFLRSERERQEYLRGWLETTCYRDAIQIRSPRAVPAVLEEITKFVGKHPFADISTIAKNLGIDARKVAAQLTILEELFVVARKNPSPLGAGKPLYYIADSGFARTLGCEDRDAVRIWLANEIHTQFAYSGVGINSLQYFQSKNRSIIDYVLPQHKTAILFSDVESVHEYALRAAKSFATRFGDWQVLVASPAPQPLKIAKNIRVIPWGKLC
jgi:predicted AAA+ superfamily ATPase